MAYKDMTTHRGEFFKFEKGAKLEGFAREVREIADNQNPGKTKQVRLIDAGAEVYFLVDSKPFCRAILSVPTGSKIKLEVGEKHPENGWQGRLMVDTSTADQQSLPLGAK
jgi:hypothetical protein